MAAVARVQSGVFQTENCAAYRDIIKEIVTTLLQQCLYSARVESHGNTHAVANKYRRGVEIWMTADAGTIDDFAKEQVNKYPLLPTLYKLTFFSMAQAIMESDRPINVNEAATDVRRGFRTLLRTVCRTDEVLSGEYLTKMSSIEKTQLIESIIRRSIIQDHAEGGITYATVPAATIAAPPVSVVSLPSTVAAPTHFPPVGTSVPTAATAPMPLQSPPDHESVNSEWGSTVKRAILSGSVAGSVAGSNAGSVAESVAESISKSPSATVASGTLLPAAPTEVGDSSLNVMTQISPQNPHGDDLPLPIGSAAGTETGWDKDLDLPNSNVSHTDEVRRKIGGAGATGEVSDITVDDSASQVAIAMRSAAQK